ncbi:Protein of unknown function [Gryllus bimaculatus]|nr:Protein of unknown function [Gryllus bimaculatus]
MAVFNCGLDRRWCKDSTAFTGLSNEKNTMPFISANGYYGYLPVYADDSNAMETNDITDSLENHRVGTFPNMTESPCSGNTMQHLSNHRPNGRCIVQKITALPRKRNSSEEVDENHKRIKKEGL